MYSVIIGILSNIHNVHSGICSAHHHYKYRQIHKFTVAICCEAVVLTKNIYISANIFANFHASICQSVNIIHQNANIIFKYSHLFAKKQVFKANI